MARRLSRRAMLAALAAAAGCSGRGSEPTTTETTAPTETATTTTAAQTTPTEEQTTPTEEQTTERTTTTEPVEVREWPDEYYSGPLVSAHEHMSGPDGFEMTKEKMDWFVRWMDRNRVDQAMAITGPRFIPVVSEHDDRLVPFYFPYGPIRNHFDELAATLAERLDRYPVYEGIGEFGLYGGLQGDGESPVPADHPEMLEVYDLAAERDVPVMVHAGSIHNSYDDPSKPVQNMAAAFEHNRDTTFLLHGDTFSGVTIDGRTDVPTGEAVSILFDRHPNFYFDVSGRSSPYAYRYNESRSDDYPAGKTTEAAAQEWFTSKLASDGGVEHLAQRYYDRYEPIFENYSDRVLWGMDASWQWHFNDWVLDTWVDVARALLGKLPEENAKNVGYRTAEELFDIDVENGDD